MMLNFRHLVGSIEDLYLERMNQFVRGEVDYKTFLEIEEYKNCMRALQRRYKMNRLKEVKVRRKRK